MIEDDDKRVPDGRPDPSEPATDATDGAPAPDRPAVAGRISLDVAAGAPQDVEALFRQAVETHSRRLLAIARAIVGYRASPEDVVQQALLNLYTHRHRYDWREPGGLMKRSVVNEALRLLRPPKMSVVADDQPAPTSKDALGGLIESETTATVKAAIAKLPDHFRAALVLCEYEQLSYQQIAEALNASVPQVKTWIHRARRQLEKSLGDYVKSKD